MLYNGHKIDKELIEKMFSVRWASYFQKKSN